MNRTEYFWKQRMWKQNRRQERNIKRRKVSGKPISDRLINNCFMNVEKNAIFGNSLRSTIIPNLCLICMRLHCFRISRGENWLLACTRCAVRLRYFCSHLVLYGSFTPPYLELKINLHCIWFWGKVKGNKRHIAKCAVATMYKLWIYRGGAENVWCARTVIWSGVYVMMAFLFIFV